MNIYIYIYIYIYRERERERERGERERGGERESERNQFTLDFLKLNHFYICYEKYQKFSNTCLIFCPRSISSSKKLVFFRLTAG